MDERRRDRGELLPEAPESFVQAIREGAEDIYRHERRRRRRMALTMAAAAALMAFAGLGVLLNRLSAPRPDNTVLSVDPDRLAPAATKDAPAPEPTALPVNLDGNLLLTDAGPFEAGEWVVVTDEDGALDYGRIVDFREQPAANARSAELNVGVQVRFLGDVDTGMSRIDYGGVEGYIDSDCLRRPPAPEKPDAAEGWRLFEAQLYITDSLGQCAEEILYEDLHAVSVYALGKLLETLEPAAEGAVREHAFGALLVARYRNEDHVEAQDNGDERFIEVRYTLPLDGSLLFLAEDGRCYSADATQKFFWGIFEDIKGKIWRAE